MKFAVVCFSTKMAVEVRSRKYDNIFIPSDVELFFHIIIPILRPIANYLFIIRTFHYFKMCWIRHKSLQHCHTQYADIADPEMYFHQKHISIINIII